MSTLWQLLNLSVAVHNCSNSKRVCRYYNSNENSLTLIAWSSRGCHIDNKTDATIWKLFLVIDNRLKLKYVETFLNRLFNRQKKWLKLQQYCFIWQLLYKFEKRFKRVQYQKVVEKKSTVTSFLIHFLMVATDNFKLPNKHFDNWYFLMSLNVKKSQLHVSYKSKIKF